MFVGDIISKVVDVITKHTMKPLLNEKKVLTTNIDNSYNENLIAFYKLLSDPSYINNVTISNPL